MSRILFAVVSALAFLPSLRADDKNPAQTAPVPRRALEFSVALENSHALRSAPSVHALVRLRGASLDKTEASRVRPVNLALVVDRAGSMQGQKIIDARDAALQMLERLRDGDRVAVVSYSSDVRVDIPTTVIDADSRTLVKNAIYRISAGGNTNLGGGLVEGHRQVRKNVSVRYVNRVLLISDGLANRGITSAAQLNRIARETSQDEIITSTFGLGLDYNEDLMTSVADHGGGNYYFVEKSTDIGPTLGSELSQMMATIAQQVQLYMELPDGVGVEEVHGFLERREGRTVIVPLGEVFAGQTRSVLWRLSLPAAPRGAEPAAAEAAAALLSQVVTLGKIELRYRDVGAETIQRSASSPLKLTLTSKQEDVDAHRDLEVQARVMEIELATTMQTAAELIDRGEYDAARETLQRVAADARKRSSGLGKYAAEVEKAIREAEELSRNVDAARENARARQSLKKRSKAAASSLRKK